MLLLVFLIASPGCQKEEVIPTDLRWGADIEPIVERACVLCHSTVDTLKGPNAHGVNLEGYEHVRRHRKTIYETVLVERTMPGRLGDSLGIRLTDEDRLRIGAWVKGGLRGRRAPGPLDQSGQQQARVLGRLDILDRLRNPTVGADDIGDPLRVRIVGFRAGVVLHPDVARGVAQEGIREAVFLCEGGVLVQGVETHADDRSAALFILGVQVAEPASLVYSAGCVGLRKEPEDDGFFPIVG